MRCEKPVDEVLAALEEDGILAGVGLGADYEALDDCLLVAVTECNPPDELKHYAAALERIARPAAAATQG